MMKRLLPLLLLLACPAHALKLVVWDNEMQTKLGAGESSGNRFNVQFVRDYSGPVRVIFSQSADERSRGLFPGLQSSYDGLLKNGQLSLFPAPDARARAAGATTAPGATQNMQAPDSQSLSRFLQQYKLSLPGTPGTQLPDWNFPPSDLKVSR